MFFCKKELDAKISNFKVSAEIPFQNFSLQERIYFKSLRLKNKCYVYHYGLQRLSVCY